HRAPPRASRPAMPPLGRVARHPRAVWGRRGPAALSALLAFIVGPSWPADQAAKRRRPAAHPASTARATALHPAAAAAVPAAAPAAGGAAVTVRNRIKAHVRVRAADLVPHELNPRTHGAAQRDALAALLGEIGFARSVLAYEVTCSDCRGSGQEAAGVGHGER